MERDYAHLPGETVGLAALVTEVSHLAPLDIHPRLSHGVLSVSVAGLVFVGDDLRDCADVRSSIALVRVRRIRRRIPTVHLYLQVSEDPRRRRASRDRVINVDVLLYYTTLTP